MNSVDGELDSSAVIFTPGFGKSESDTDLSSTFIHINEELTVFNERQHAMPKMPSWRRVFSRNRTSSNEDYSEHIFPEDQLADSDPTGGGVVDIRASSSLSDFVGKMKVKRAVKARRDSMDRLPHQYNKTYDDPLSSIWDLKRLSLHVKKDKRSFFSDTWLVRKLNVKNEIMKKTPFQTHLKQSFKLETTEKNDGFAIWKLILSPCGRWLLAGTQKGWIYLYETETDNHKGLFNDLPSGIFPAHEGAVGDLLWLPSSPDHEPMFVSIGLDRRMSVWVISSPHPIESVRTSEWSSSITLHPKDPTQLFLGSLDATVQLWRLQIRTTEDKINARLSMIDYVRVPDLVTAVSLSPDGQCLAVGMRRGSVAIYDSHSLRFVTEIECKGKRSRWRNISQRVVGISWAQDSERFVATLHDSTLRIVNLRKQKNQTDRAMMTLTGHTLQHVLLTGTFTDEASGTERVLIGSEDHFLYCYTPSVGSDGGFVDKIKVTKDLMTAFTLAHSPFNQFLNDEVHKALKSKLGNVEGTSLETTAEGELTSSSGQYELRWRTPNYMCAIIGTYTGTIKVLVNFGVER